MFLTAAARKYWRYYSPQYKETKKASICNECGKWVPEVEVDHTEPIGSRPRDAVNFIDLPRWLNRLFYLPVQGLCPKHHKDKTSYERMRRKRNRTQD